ncbi:MAG: site-specific integrase [Anaerolineae bacterium]|nr:site-specific integrase [Anaerolineae bacterium]
MADMENEQGHAAQLSLFGTTETPAPTPEPAPKPDLDAGSALNKALGAFEHYMEQRGFTFNTRQAFRLDLQLLSEYLGPGVALGHIATANLSAFLSWMQDSRGIPCKPKTLERRITTLKVFFSWLTEIGTLTRDPAAPLIHTQAKPPAPDFLTEAQIQSVLEVAQRLRAGGAEQQPDPRPYTLITLLLHTGIKKGECVKIVPNHIDLTNPARPALWIRYSQPRRQHKERRIALPDWWPPVLHEYLQVYHPRQYLFPWTPRNLEYILTRVGAEAGLERLSFEMLRWTCAVRDFVSGMDRDALRQKLGLSEISWYEVESTLASLALLLPPEP